MNSKVIAAQMKVTCRPSVLGQALQVVSRAISSWTTLPILEYRLLYQLFGLHQFFPYRLIVLLLYLVAAALLLAVMWRARVHPFIAVAAATNAGIIFR